MPVLADKHRHDAQSRALPLPERRRTSIGTPALAQSTTTPTAWLAEWRLGLKMKPSGAPGHTPSTSLRQPAQPSPAQPREAGEAPRNPMFPSWLLARCSPSWAHDDVHRERDREGKPTRTRRPDARGAPPFRKRFLVPSLARDRPCKKEERSWEPRAPLFPRTWPTFRAVVPRLTLSMSRP